MRQVRAALAAGEDADSETGSGPGPEGSGGGRIASRAGNDAPRQDMEEDAPCAG